ncbi:NADPH-dependent FMN reductase [Streptomyces sp.]|uniref:NADPH-dependent FMN reductase n=1 Tax=Streptomyces sp. TaxID=1931 RepID=UPI002F41C0EE
MTSSADTAAAPPVVVGIGGTTRPGSTTDRALRLTLAAAEQAGARTLFFGGDFLARLPMYQAGDPVRTDESVQLVEAVRGCAGLVVASPGYHGGVSGLVKNALDYIEELRGDDRPYLDQRSVGCVVTAHGWQACGTTLGALRSIVHALRAWPTPLGATINTSEPVFDASGACLDVKAASQLALVGRQVVQFTGCPAARSGLPEPVLS